MKERPRLGAHVEGGGVRFSCFTDAKTCAVRLLAPGGVELARHDLAKLDDGYFSALVEGVRDGALYEFLVDGQRLPDPYARVLPEGVHGPAAVVAPRTPPRPNSRLLPLAQQVIYELHVGTFIVERLPELATLGVTTIELMPIASFAGSRGWGYDGVALYAPHPAYGSPDELAYLIDQAHALGLNVWLDVVYNHFGPSGNYLSAYSKRYFHPDLHNAWGQAPNFELPAMRDLVLDNVRYWLTEFGFDGLRLDATHALLDRSERHILAEIAEVAHACTPRRVVVAEDERNEADLVTGIGLDGVWADDFHHQVRVTLTRERDGYYSAYEPSVAGIARAIEQGWLYIGQKNPLSGAPRGTPATELRAEQLIYCLQNHDQVGNRAMGDRLSASISPEAYRAVSLLLLFLPMTPMLFMGQEWGARTPFAYFTDHDAELGKLVSEGRRREFAGFSHFKDEHARAKIPDPQALSTFESSRLDWTERATEEAHRTLTLYTQALELRRSDPVLSASGRAGLSARAIDDVLCVERRLGAERRVLLVNFGRANRELSELGLRLGETRRLLESDPTPHDDSLPAESAVLLAATMEPA